MRKTLSLIVIVGLWTLAGCVQSAPGPEGSTEIADWVPEYTDGVLQPTADGFPDHELRLTVVDEPGTRDDLYARALADAVEGISPVDVIVSNEPRPRGGTFHALADTLKLSDAAEYHPVVLSIPGSVSDFHVDPIEQELGRGLDEVDFIIATEEQPFVMVQRADAPWGVSFDGFVEHARAHPGEVVYVSSSVGSGVDIAMEWLLSSLDIEVRKVPTGGGGVGVDTVAAGEGDVTMSVPDRVRPGIEGGFLDPIWLTSDEVPNEWTARGVATSVDLVDYDVEPAQWGSLMGLAVPVEARDDHAAWLSELFARATEAETYLDRVGLGSFIEANLLDTQAADEVAAEVYETSEGIIRRLGLHHSER